MGEHTARDGAGIDPLVLAALNSRPAVAGTPGTPASRTDRAAGDEGSGLGWPGDPADGTGLGWPGDLDDRATAQDVRVDTGAGTDGPPARRRNWRRIFGGRAA